MRLKVVLFSLFKGEGLIKFDKKNLSVQETHRVIVKNKKNTLIAFLYEENKAYLPKENIIISLARYLSMLNLVKSMIK